MPIENRAYLKKRLELACLVADQHRVLKEHTLPALAFRGIEIVRFDQLTADKRRLFQDYFARSVYPLLTPLVIDSGHPFPNVRHLALNMALMIERREGELIQQFFAVVQAPPVLRRLVALPNGRGRRLALFLEDLIGSQLAQLFGGFRVLDHTTFRVTRFSNTSLEDGEAEDFLDKFESARCSQIRGEAVRLEIAATAGARFVQMLQDALELAPCDVYRVAEPIAPTPKSGRVCRVCKSHQIRTNSGVEWWDSQTRPTIPMCFSESRT